MIMPGMLHVVSEFHAPVEFVSLSLTVFILGNSLLQLFLGPLAEYFGKRRVILMGNCLFLIFTICLVMSQNIYEFMLGRLLQGSGLAFVAMGYALVHEKFNDRQAVKICSLMGNVSLLAPLLGPLLGVIIIQNSSWRHIFIVTGFIAIISLIGLYLFTPKTETKNKH
jgi:DHA1 family multidrug/chloramphenicol efflux transport protein-like MFS transporter